MHLRGKVHNPENADLSKELCNLCDQVPGLQLPAAQDLQVPVRSNKTGQLLSKGSLTHEIIDTVLVSRCEWFTLLTEMSKDLKRTGRQSYLLAIFGIGDCVPLLPFHKDHLRITKCSILSFVGTASRSYVPYTFPSNAIAIVGAACRLPGADNLEELWDLMSRGASMAEEIPLDRFDLPRSFRASQDEKWTAKRKFYGNFIDDVAGFDNTFFGISPKAAMYMDPQQRLLLEVAFQAMDSCGYLHSHRREAGERVGCFIGASYTEYLENTSSHGSTAYTSTGTIRAFLSGRISHYFGWTGPSEVIDTACSASLVAIHRACQAIQTGECPMALAGGVNIITGIHNFLDLGKAGFLSATGQCKPFDQAADGYCRADGVGLVVLKLLRQAVADGDRILGVIPGIATNQGGLSSSITVPHSPTQVALYQRILHKAGMDADQVSYIEAHGTGTQVGDPLEMASIREVFGGSDRTHPLYVGSLKANIGHSETGAGVASLLKVLAMIAHGSIPPLAGFRSLNPKIRPLAADKICIASKVVPWVATNRIACVNSYGAAGSNSALLCCEWLSQDVDIARDSPINGASYPVVISAASRESLHAYANSLSSYIERAGEELSLGDLAFTLSERRKYHQVRWVTMESDLGNLSQCLKTNALEDCFEVPTVPKRVVLVFSGQTKRTVGLNVRLYQLYPRLRSYLDRCNEIVTTLGFPAIIPAIFQPEPISNVVTLQCGTFALQYACAQSWLDAGLVVAAVLGHSFGELTALTVSGVLSLEDGLKLVATRASLMETNWGPDHGTMLAIHGSREVVRDVIASVPLDSTNEELEIACYNAPGSQVVVGTPSAIAKTEHFIKEESRFSGLRYQRLDVSRGFHSRFTEPLLEDLDSFSRTLTFHKPRIPLEACTENPLDTIDFNRISQHTRNPVYFLDAVRRLEHSFEQCVWLEASIDSPIVSMIKRSVKTPEAHIFQALNTNSMLNPLAVISETTAALWREGIPTSFWGFLSPQKAGFKQVWLPPYQFQRTSYWLKNVDRVIEAQASLSAIKTEESRREEFTSLVTYRDNAEYSNAYRQFTIHMTTKRYIQIVSAHAVRGKPLCPASMYMECAVMAAKIMGHDLREKPIDFHDLSFQGVLGVDYGRDVSLSLERHSDLLSWNFSVQSSLKGDPNLKLTTHARGKFDLVTQPDFHVYERLIYSRMNELLANPNVEKLKCKRAYGLFSRVVQYGNLLQGISYVTLAEGQAAAEINIPEVNADVTESTVTEICNSVTLDTFIQVVGLLINSSDDCSHDEVYIATGIDRISMLPCGIQRSKSWKVYAIATPLRDSSVKGDMFVFTKDGNLVMTGIGVRFSRLPIPQFEKLLEAANPSHPQNISAWKQNSLAAGAVGTEYHANVDINSSNGRSEGAEILTPESPEEVIDSLKLLVAPYIGLLETTIADEASMVQLGLDSLAAVELAGELKSLFGKEIPSGDLLAANVHDLCQFFFTSPSSKPVSVMTKVSALATSNSEINATHRKKDYLHPSMPAKLDSLDQQRVLQMIFEICGAPVNTISDETFQDLGADSLSMIELKSSIEQEFSVTIKDDDLSLQSTVRETLEYLGVGENYKIASDLSPAASTESSVPRAPAAVNMGPRLGLDGLGNHNGILNNAWNVAGDPKLTVLSSSNPLRTRREYSSKSRLIQGDHKSGLPALFLIAPGSGVSEVYTKLPPFASGLPIYALQSPFVHAPEELTCSFETMASIYLKEIRRIQPRGPYLFGGWSIGGMFAYEAARQVILQGEEVRGIIMLDSPCPKPRPDMPEPTVEILDRTGLFRQIRGDGKQDSEISHLRKRHVVSTFKMVKSYRPTPMDPGRRPTHVFLMWAKYGVYDVMADVVKESSREAADRYSSGLTQSSELESGGLIKVWQTIERSSYGPCGWEELIGDEGVECCIIDGDHESIMVQPHVSFFFFFSCLHLLILNDADKQRLK